MEIPAGTRSHDLSYLHNPRATRAKPAGREPCRNTRSNAVPLELNSLSRSQCLQVSIWKNNTSAQTGTTERHYLTQGPHVTFVGFQVTGSLSKWNLLKKETWF